MNGHFEFDKGAYPYQSQYVNRGLRRIVFVPDLEPLTAVPLPEVVAEEVAREINAEYWRNKRPVHGSDGWAGELQSRVHLALRNAHERKLITGEQYSQLKRLTATAV